MYLVLLCTSKTNVLPNSVPHQFELLWDWEGGGRNLLILFFGEGRGLIVTFLVIICTPLRG